MFMQPDTQTGTINPVFAEYAAQQLQEATGGIDRVFDNLRKIARGDDPDANGYDRLRATRVLYDRGMGKVTKNQPRTPIPQSERPTESEESNNHTNHSSDTPRIAAESTRPVPASKRSSTTHSALLRHPSGSTIPDMSPTLPATPPTSYARHSTTYSKSPTTEPSSPQS